MRTVFRCVDLMRSYVTLAQGPRSVISPHPIHACARGCLTVFFLLSLYFFLKSFFHIFLIPAMVPDENSMEDPLCNSSFGSMVNLDYVTPDTAFVSGLGGFGEIWVLDRMLGFDQTSFLLLPVLWSRIRSLKLQGFWMSLISSMLSSVRPGCRFFCRSGHPVVTVDQFLSFVVSFLSQEAELHLPSSGGCSGQEVHCREAGWLGLE